MCWRFLEDFHLENKKGITAKKNFKHIPETNIILCAYSNNCNNNNTKTFKLGLYDP